jgi:hypothetical protein
MSTIRIFRIAGADCRPRRQILLKYPRPKTEPDSPICRKSACRSCPYGVGRPLIGYLPPAARTREGLDICLSPPRFVQDVAKPATIRRKRGKCFCKPGVQQPRNLSASHIEEHDIRSRVREFFDEDQRLPVGRKGDGAKRPVSAENRVGAVWQGSIRSSCCGRRMADTAVHLVGRVSPKAKRNPRDKHADFLQSGVGALKNRIQESGSAAKC